MLGHAFFFADSVWLVLECKSGGRRRGSRMFWKNANLCTALPRQRHLLSRLRVGGPGDRHPDEGPALGYRFIWSDNDDRPEFLLAMAFDPDADDLTIEEAPRTFPDALPICGLCQSSSNQASGGGDVRANSSKVA